eukprot:gene6438-7100_t
MMRFLIVASLFLLFTVVISIEARGLLSGLGLCKTALQLNSNATQPTPYFPSWDDLLDSINEYYDYFINFCLNRQHEYREFETAAIAQLLNKLHKKQSDPRGEHRFSGLIQQVVSLAIKYQTADHMEHWEYLGHEDDIIVWKLKKHIMEDPDACKWPCVKSHTTIDLPVEKLAQLMLDSSKVHVLNRYSVGREDVEMLGSTSKIVWSKTKIPYTPKPYDFCTLMHAMEDRDSRCTMILTKAAIHDKVPKLKDFSRSEILFGLSILRPCATDSSKTDYTLINHVKYPGVPPFLVSRSCYTGALTYLKQLKAGAAKFRASGGNGGNGGGNSNSCR